MCALARWFLRLHRRSDPRMYFHAAEKEEDGDDDDEEAEVWTSIKTDGGEMSNTSGRE